MTRRLYIITLTLVLWVCSLPSARALYIREYTEERPLIIASDWEFPPYEFLNDMGNPDGYNIEVLDLILSQLGIPHKYEMNEWYKCTESFESRKADLIHALTFKYQHAPYVMTQNMITYYNVRIARFHTTPPIHHIRDITENNTVVLKKNDYGDLRLAEMNDLAFHTEYHSSREALIGLRSGKYKYYIWGEVPLQSKLKEYGVDGVVLDEIDIPAGELRIIGYDKELIDAIDDTYARLEQAGDIERIRDKWFHPERVHNDTSPVTLILLLGVIIAGIIAFLLSRLIRTRVRVAITRTVDLNRMMNQALNMGAYGIVEFDVINNTLRNVHGSVLPYEGITPEEFLARMKPVQATILHQNNQGLIRGFADSFELTISLNTGSLEEPVWKDFYGNALAEKENGHTRYIIYTVQDMTQALLEEQENRVTGSKFHKMFETNPIAMAFYDTNGYPIDINAKMREICGITDDSMMTYWQSLSIFDTPLMEGQITRDTREVFHVCQRMFYPDLGIFKYIEVKVYPALDENGELRYFICTARDLTHEREIYLQQRRHEREMEKANASIQSYEDQLRYLLDNSKMFIWKYDPFTNQIAISRSGHKSDYQETIDQFFKDIDSTDLTEALEQVRVSVTEKKPYNVVAHFNTTPMEKHPVWYAINGIPKTKRDGSLSHFFGIARNITDLMEAQRKLKEETKRAEDSGKMKSAFLANMTHEIRTPLNAIVGFSDLLPVVDTNEERMNFIRIIRNNCDMLMRLINDILEASNMGQALAIKPEPCDFAQVFDDICQTLAQRVQEPGVEFIKDNPYASFPATLDKGRIQQVLTNFVTNAVKYTHQGHIKVGYREEQEGIYFYCEDTGAGIPKEKQASVFERFVKLNDFVQGTGLGLSICQAIANRCGGRIGVTSEGEGHGSTFWLWTPREIAGVSG